VKRGIVIAVLAFVASWPLVQRGLVAGYGIDPWKLGGFAMYAAPSPPLLVVLVDPDRAGTAIDERTLSAPLRRALDRFRIERHALGRLREPRALAAAVLAERPDLAALVVVVQTARLDVRTARMTTSRDAYAYGPDGPIAQQQSPR
jgi:hypothetical protein